ncbi:MAG TPA: rhamnan synthesis F family protein [Saprospiraceae bacterium]|nr:rhamnan synthesis F family protein [Saprospiraceae bacterium]
MLNSKFSLWYYLSRPQKERVKTSLFSTFAFLFSGNPKYEHWKGSRRFINESLKRKLFNRFFIFSKSSYQWAFPTLTPTQNPAPIENVAVHIHVYYVDIFAKILHQLKNSGLPQLTLYITCQEEIASKTEELMTPTGMNNKIYILPNRGRDLYPFLHVLPDLLSSGCSLILKLHTKKSTHLKGTRIWLDDILNKLTQPNQVVKILKLMEHYPEIGLIGPEEHVLPVYLYYGENAITLSALCEKMGLPDKDSGQLHFVGGTMFFARPEALKPLMDLNLTLEDFEKENGQLDGTMAHAMERMVGASVVKAGMVIADTGSELNDVHFTVQTSYAFAR